MLRIASALAAKRSTGSLRQCLVPRRTLADIPVRKNITLEERAALRAARKKRASQALAQGGEGSAAGASSSGAAKSGPGLLSPTNAYVWYMMVLVPSAMITWAINDENSPPAQFSRLIGLTKLLTGVTDEISKPSHDTLLPAWDQVSIDRCSTIGGRRTARSDCLQAYTLFLHQNSGALSSGHSHPLTCRYR